MATLTHIATTVDFIGDTIRSHAPHLIWIQHYFLLNYSEFWFESQVTADSLTQKFCNVKIFHNSIAHRIGPISKFILFRNSRKNISFQTPFPVFAILFSANFVIQNTWHTRNIPAKTHTTDAFWAFIYDIMVHLWYQFVFIFSVLVTFRMNNNDGLFGFFFKFILKGFDCLELILDNINRWVYTALNKTYISLHLPILIIGSFLKMIKSKPFWMEFPNDFQKFRSDWINEFERIENKWPTITIVTISDWNKCALMVPRSNKPWEKRANLESTAVDEVNFEFTVVY